MISQAFINRVREIVPASLAITVSERTEGETLYVDVTAGPDGQAPGYDISFEEVGEEAMVQLVQQWIASEPWVTASLLWPSGLGPYPGVIRTAE